MNHIDNASIEIQKRKIGSQQPPFIIAEISANHRGSLDEALKIVEAAKEAGVDAVKLQTYTADTLTINCDKEDFCICSADSPWEGRNLYQLYQEAYTPWEWHKPIFDKCRELNLIGFSTAFDNSAVEFLETLEVPAYKIASFENTDVGLIEAIKKTGKPIIISTGTAYLQEFLETLTGLQRDCPNKFAVLKCISAYPAPACEMNLNTIPHMKNLFQCPIGLSDHSLGVGAAIAAVTLGACVIEKHLTLSREAGGVDSSFSLEPHEMKTLCTEVRRAWESLGTVMYNLQPSETYNRKFRRSLYCIKDLMAGEAITEENVKSIRPGLGLETKYFKDILGKKVKVAVPRGTALRWDIF